MLLRGQASDLVSGRKRVVDLRQPWFPDRAQHRHHPSVSIASSVDTIIVSPHPSFAINFFGGRYSVALGVRLLQPPHMTAFLGAIEG